MAKLVRRNFNWLRLSSSCLLPFVVLQAMWITSEYSLVKAAEKKSGKSSSSDVLKAATNELSADHVSGGSIDEVLNQENVTRGVKTAPLPLVSDLAFIRRLSVDLIGRIPTTAEIEEFESWPEAERRTMLVDQLMSDDRFVDRWTTFYADLLRLRSNAEGGAAAIAYIHRSLADEVPYDELCRQLISKNGKAGAVPEVGFILGDGADPMAMAGVTSQVFLGIRVACAQCHDHPFDVWKREDFYGLAAFFGKTRRVENQFTNTIYTTEAGDTLVLWPPEGVGKPEERKPMEPRFPFAMLPEDHPSVVRLNARRKALAAEKAALLAQQSAEVDTDDVLDDLLADADKKVEQQTRKEGIDESLAEARTEVRKIGRTGGRNTTSEWRTELAEEITSPRNRYFSRCFVNRVWNELIGRGFVNPLDDFNQNNPPSHPQSLDYLADEFVANGYDLKTLVRMIVTSDIYQRGHTDIAEESVRNELEESFLALPHRRMNSEALYDSIVIAGHLFGVKHEAGKNMKTVWTETRVPKQPGGLNSPLLAGGDGKSMKREMAAADSEEPLPGYSLESAVELDFDALLEENPEDLVAADDEGEGVKVEQMRAMSKEEIEAERMRMQAQQNSFSYIERFVRQRIDDNPSFISSFRMASPADSEHFLRVFGQPERIQLGETRDHAPSMRQALMLLNGRLSHEAARVGELEPIFEYLVGPRKNIEKAVELAYVEVLTRKPTSQEVEEGVEIVNTADNSLNGVADLRWVLLNCNEFRFVP
ncbi:MAG: DUF1549 and DUF1553 domain-containing protein [Planctomycetota bacterium]|nr:DUF1549 and DUF1553 domain-containing protein [Planctomycetota bacterium]